MSNSKAVTVTGGVGFGGMLAILFIALKLTNVIAWSWIWVLAPIWIPWVIIIGVVLIGSLIVLIGALASK